MSEIFAPSGECKIPLCGVKLRLCHSEIFCLRQNVKEDFCKAKIN